MSEYNPFEDSMPGKGLHEINNAPQGSAAAAAPAAPENPPYIPPPNPPYEPYVPAPAAPMAYQPTQASPVTPPPGSSIHYAANGGGYASAPAVRYDLAGNPLPPEPMAAPPQAPYAPPHSPYGGPPPQQPYNGGYGAPGAYGGPQAPYGGPQAPYGAPQGAWPPPPGGGSALFGMQEMNTSGQQGAVPPEIERLHWNWGAYFLPVLWLRWHGMTSFAGVLAGTGLIFRVMRYISGPMQPVMWAVYALFWFSVSVYMGLNGHKMAWRNRRYFGGVDEFFKVERAWLIGGALAGPVLSIAFIILGIVLLTAAAMPSHSYSPYGAGSSYSSPSGAGSFGDGTTQQPSGYTDNGAAQPGYNQPTYNGAYNAQPPASGYQPN